MSATYPSLHTHPPGDEACPDLWDALRDVQDTELPISLVDLGLIMAVRRLGNVVEIDLTFTAMGCPATEFIMDDIRARLLREPGVREVTIGIVWKPVWSKARLTEEGIEAMQQWGVAV
jgi:metal-sulfur cluster biosynthetic enzyme